ncbi:TPA: hypothetical protein ACH9ML_005282, partial [Escherichia coli]
MVSGWWGKGAPSTIKSVYPILKRDGNWQPGWADAITIQQRLNVEAGQDNSKRAARTVLTGMCYSVGSATR